MLRKSHLFFFLIGIAVGLMALIASGFPKFVSAAAVETSGSTSAKGIKVVMNGKVFQPNSPPFIDVGTVYLPVRDIGGLLGTSVSWNASAKTVAMYYPELTVKLVYGASNAAVNGKPVALIAPLRIVDGRIYAPLRFFSEATGADVKWEASTRTANIARSVDFVRSYASGILWLNRETGDLYSAKDDSSPAVGIGRLDAMLQGEVTLHGGWGQGGNTVLTVVDHYGEPADRYDAYGILLHGGRVVAQTKASYEGRYESTATGFQVYDPDGWIQYAVLTDGKIVTVYDDQGKAVKTYDVPKLTGADDVYFVQGIGDDYLVVRPNRTGLLTLVDLKDDSVVTLADKLLTGKDLANARGGETPARGDGLLYAGNDENGQLYFYYADPAENGNGDSMRLTYERPSYQEERDALPKPRTLSEMAAGCSADTVAAVNFQEGDQLYVPYVGADKEDRDGIALACGILKKFASKGVEETLPAYFLDRFFHGMSIDFKQGDGVQIYEIGGGKMAIGAGEGGKTVVLKDDDAVRDYGRLEVLPTELAVTPNPAYFGEKLHFEGDNGDSQASTPFVVTWLPILDHYSSTDPDPSLVIYTGTTTFGRYDVTFAIPAYGKAADGTLKPIRPGKGAIRIPSLNGGPFSTTNIDLLPAGKPFLSVDGVPAADPSLAPITVSGHVLVPVRGVAKLAGQPVVWDAASGSVLIRTKPSEAAAGGATKGAATLWINGKKAAADLQPVVRGGIAYMPIRAVTAAFGLPVVWDGGSRSVNVTTTNGER